MKTDRAVLLIAVAVVLACGLCGYQAIAQDLAGEAQFRVITIGHITAATPLAGAGMFQGITAFGPNSPAAGDWPCFGGGSGCAAVPAGGLVVGTPEQVWPKGCAGCGTIYYTFQTTSATGNANVAVSVTQGSPATKIFSLSGSIGTIPSNVIEAVTVGPISFTGGVAGAATINVSTTIGSATIKGGAKIVLH